MKQTYEVKVRTVGYELWYVDAESRKEAEEAWCEGELVHSEIEDTELLHIKEIND